MAGARALLCAAVVMERMMVTYTFQSYPASVKVRFSCVLCQKQNRTRTFRRACTVNPFNKNGDGSFRTPSEVRAQSLAGAKADRDVFMRKPVCAACENALTHTERQALHQERAALAASEGRSDG